MMENESDVERTSAWRARHQKSVPARRRLSAIRSTLSPRRIIILIKPQTTARRP